ncbi:MAG: hypothetical protein ABIK09_14825 [Pseudomonadota bacterium]
MLRRMSIAVFVLFSGVLTVPAVASAQEEPTLVLDALGMPPRPTMDCGGRDAIQRWENERLVRRNRQARERTWEALYRITGRIQDMSNVVLEATHRSRRAVFESCVSGEPLMDLTCLAATRRRPELCKVKNHPAFYRGCQVSVTAIMAALEGDHLRCAELKDSHLRRLCERTTLGRPERSIGCAADDGTCHTLTLLNLDVCRRAWPLIESIPPLLLICRWRVLAEALRVDPALSCETVPVPVREICRAVVSGDPATCLTTPGEHGVAVLARRCRNEQVLVPEVPLDQVAYGKGVVISVPMINPFGTVAACRLTARLSEGDRVRFEATSEPFTLPPGLWGEAVDALHLKRFRMDPADVGLDLSVTADCAWAPSDDRPHLSDGTPVVD